MDKKSYKNIFIYYNGCAVFKDLCSATINSVNTLYLIVSKRNGYIKKKKRDWVFDTSCFWWKQGYTEKLWRTME